jgi:hypothetical protein
MGNNTSGFENNFREDPLWRCPFPDECNDLWRYPQFLQELGKRIQDPSSHLIGHSEKAEPIFGFVFGHGPVSVSLVAGAHADEPVGPNTLYRLSLEILDNPSRFGTMLEQFRFLVIPHVNPDGDAANASWVDRWPELAPFLAGMKRELPGRDIEFGYPDMRPENSAASAFWERTGPAHLHISLHGMQFSEGFLLLVNDEWEERSRVWRSRFERTMRAEGLLPHDHDRGGEKGFNYMGPGFTSTPKGTAMREFFLQAGDPETASLFHQSSMEFHLEQNPGTLCLVTEFPLFQVENSGHAGTPVNYLALKQEWAGLREKGCEPDPAQVERLVDKFRIRPLPLGKAMRLQRRTVRKAMDLVLDGWKKSG